MGTILPYVGDIKDIPKGWALCDGTNNTPDLTGRFLEGVTANPKSFKDAGLPNITGYITRLFGEESNMIYWGGALKWIREANRTSYNGLPYIERGSIEIDASLVSPVYRNDITTVQPSSYTVYYIMKIKK